MTSIPCYVKTKTGKSYYRVNPKRRYWLEVVGMRGLTTALKLSNSSEDPWNMLSLITTIRKYDLNVEDMRKWSDRNERKKFEKLLIDAGEVAEFRTVYETKKKSHTGL